jgi:hypothetical protein
MEFREIVPFCKQTWAINNANAVSPKNKTDIRIASTTKTVRTNLRIPAISQVI